MNERPNTPETKEKTKHPILFILGLLVVVAVVGYALCGNPFEAITAENNAKQHAGTANVNDEADFYGIDNPAGKTIECELSFLDMDGNNVATPRPVHPDHPSNPNSGKLQSDTEYIVRFNFPNLLRAEIENDDCRFDAAVKYEFEVRGANQAHFQVKLYNRNTGNLYIANGTIPAADDLCLKHSLDKGTKSISYRPEMENDHFAFSVYTSALPDAGPKVTSDASYGGWGYSLHYTIAGMTSDEWATPYE